MYIDLSVLHDAEHPERSIDASWWTRHHLPPNVHFGLRRLDETQYERSARPPRFVRRVAPATARAPALRSLRSMAPAYTDWSDDEDAQL